MRKKIILALIENKSGMYNCIVHTGSFPIFPPYKYRKQLNEIYHGKYFV